MGNRVQLVYPKIRKEILRERLRRWFPDLYERLAVRLVARNDRRYRRLQNGLFDDLSRMADRPFHIEIETLNKCNSTCEFCPVNRHADPRPYQRMTEELFHGIIDELAEWNYDQTLNLFSNNEPFLDKRIFEFAEYSRRKLPAAFIQIISNGTSLNIEKVERVLPHLSRLVINDYGYDFELSDNIRAIVDHVEANRPEWADRLVVGVRRLTEYKTNRGGEAPNRKVRSVTYASRCAYPFFQMVVRPDGKISLCCNDALGQVTLGDAGKTSLRDAWHSEARRDVQRAMMDGRDNVGLCAKCDNLSWAKPKRIARAIETGNFTTVPAPASAGAPEATGDPAGATDGHAPAPQTASASRQSDRFAA